VAAGQAGALQVSGPRAQGREPRPDLPFQLVAEGLPGGEQNMAPYTLLVAGWQFDEATPGFILLADDSAPGSETLLDSACVVAH